MNRELRLGLGVCLMTFACVDGHRVGDEVGVGGRLGTGGKSGATAGRAATGAATSIGGLKTSQGGASALGGMGAAGASGLTSQGGSRDISEGGAGGWATGSAGSQSPGGAGSAGASSQVPYCRASSNPIGPRTPCPVDFCASLNAALASSDGGTFIFSGAEVRAGRCMAPEDTFDAVYFGTGFFSDRCYYRAGALVGIVHWGDTTVYSSDGCTIFRGPVVYGEFPDTALTEYSKGCPGLTTYREMRSGEAGAGGALNGPEIGDCYEASDATCGPC